jgi:hypothetical protein
MGLLSVSIKVSQATPFQGPGDGGRRPNDGKGPALPLRGLLQHENLSGKAHPEKLQATNIQSDPVACLRSMAKCRYHGLKLIIPGGTRNDNSDVPRLLSIKPYAGPLDAAASFIPV